MTSAHRISATDWEAIKFKYVQQGASKEALCEEFAIKPATLRQRIHRGAWDKERHAVSAAVTAEAAAVVQTDRKKSLAEWNENDLKIATALRGHIAQVLQDAHNQKLRLPAATIRILVSSAESAQRIARLALGVSTSSVGLGGGPDGRQPIPMQPVSGPGGQTITLQEYLQARAAVLAEYGQ